MLHGLVERRRDARGLPRCLTVGRACGRSTRSAIRTSFPAGSGSASASPARWPCKPEVHRLRRAGLGARRVDPGADHQSAAGPERPVRPRPTCSSPTISRWCGISPTASRSCISARSSRPRPARRCSRAPRHPYTRALLAAVPIPDPAVKRERAMLAGEVPSPLAPPPGCRFHTRCPYAQERCRVEEPALLVDEGEHATACHFWPDLPPARRYPAPVPATLGWRGCRLISTDRSRPKHRRLVPLLQKT